MRPVSTPTPQTAGPAANAGARADADWSERAGRLYTELESPARAMVRRAYGRAFSDDEIDDIYSGAWVGTLRALGRRQAEMTDEDVGRYLLAAVANHASKELRRRRRKPTAPLELVDGVPDASESPAERAVGAERSRITRDLLASLPPRRRAVMYLRYGWGLDPSQVRELIDGLSPRAYRKEITRGVDELTERMRRFEQGDWCDDREPLLKAYASGLADAEERRQAQAHLAHCNDCADFVSRLGGHLHDFGAAISLPIALDAVDGNLSLDQRLGELGERVREAAGGLVARGGETVEPATQALAAGGSRGAGATAGAGLLAKLGSLGTAGKIAVACLGGGAAATACVSVGVIPAVVSDAGVERVRSAPANPSHRAGDSRTRLPIDAQVARPEPKQEPPPAAPRREPKPPEPEPQSEPQPAPAADPVAPSTPPVQQEFGVPAAATGSGGGGGGGSAAASGSGSGGGGGSAVRREFLP